MNTTHLISPSSKDTNVTKTRSESTKALALQQLNSKPNQVSTVLLYGVQIVALIIDSTERLCLAQISNTLLKHFSYNEIHNRRVALGITCVQCTPVQLEILRRAGAMPVSSRRCGMITRREAERLCKSFLGDNAPPRLPDDFAFSVHHECAWGCRGAFIPSRYNSSRAKCIKCSYCGLFFSPNKFIFHSHRVGPGDKYTQPDAANFNSWRRHMKLSGTPPDEVIHAWEDVKAMFNGGTRKRMLSHTRREVTSKRSPPSISSPEPVAFPAPRRPIIPSPRVPGFPEVPFPRSLVVDYVWQNGFAPYALPWLKRGLWNDGGSFRTPIADEQRSPSPASDEETVDVVTTEEDAPAQSNWETEHSDGYCQELDCTIVPKVERDDCEAEISDASLTSQSSSCQVSPKPNPPLKHGIRAITGEDSPVKITREMWPVSLYSSILHTNGDHRGIVADNCTVCLPTAPSSGGLR